MNHKSGNPHSIIGIITSIKTRPLEKEIADLRRKLEEMTGLHDSAHAVIAAKEANLTAYHEQLDAANATIEGLRGYKNLVEKAIVENVLLCEICMAKDCKEYIDDSSCKDKIAKALASTTPERELIVSASNQELLKDKKLLTACVARINKYNTPPESPWTTIVLGDDSTLPPMVSGSVRFTELVELRGVIGRIDRGMGGWTDVNYKSVVEWRLLPPTPEKGIGQ